MDGFARDLFCSVARARRECFIFRRDVRRRFVDYVRCAKRVSNPVRDLMYRYRVAGAFNVELFGDRIYCANGVRPLREEFRTLQVQGDVLGERARVKRTRLYFRNPVLGLRREVGSEL